MNKFILYICPTGPLAEQIEQYYVHARAEVGPNPAHDYMPHGSLTGFFPDEPATTAGYVALLAQLVAEFAPSQPTPVLRITHVMLNERFHGLELESPWLKALTAAFAERAESPTRPEAIRCKEWLHLSFAYGFPPEQHEPLLRLAGALIDPTAPVQWALRFYERHSGQRWTCHGEWLLP